MVNLAEYLAVKRAAELLGEKQPEMDRLLKLFAGMRTRRTELIAATFFVWNDLLLDAKSPSDAEITDEFYNWHESKRKKFTPDKVAWAIQWLQENDMAPVGLGRKTVPPSSPDGH